MPPVPGRTACATRSTRRNAIRPLRGSHLVLPNAKLPVKDALTLFHPVDKRPVFIFPWEGTTVVGTTDLDHDEDLDEGACYQ